jgi:hypothetical protein
MHSGSAFLKERDEMPTLERLPSLATRADKVEIYRRLVDIRDTNLETL